MAMIHCLVLLLSLLPQEKGAVDPKRLEALAAQLADEDWNVRTKAEEALAEIGAAAIPHLEKLLGHPDLEVAGRAKSALKKIRRGEYLEQLRGMIPESANPESIVREIASSDYVEKCRGLRLIIAIDDDDLLSSIVNLILARDEEIGWSIGPETYEMHRGILHLTRDRGIALDPPYLRRVLASDVPELQKWVLGVGIPIPDEDLIRLLKIGVPHIKISVMQHHGGRPALRPHVRALLDDVDETVRAQALHASNGVIEGEEENLQNWYKQKVLAMTRDPSGGVRTAALGFANQRDFLDDRQFMDFLDDGDAGVRCVTINILGQREFRPAGEKITALLKDGSPSVRAVALDALRRISGMELPWENVIRMGEKRMDEEVAISMHDLFCWRAAERMGKKSNDGFDFFTIVNSVGGEEWTVDNFKDFVKRLTDLRSDKDLMAIVEKQGLQESFAEIDRSIRETTVIYLTTSSDVPTDLRTKIAEMLAEHLPGVLNEGFLVRLEMGGDIAPLIPVFRQHGESMSRLEKIGAASVDYGVCRSVLRLMLIVRVGGERSARILELCDYEEFPVIPACKAITMTGPERAAEVRRILDRKFESDGIRSGLLSLLAEFGVREVIPEFRKMVEHHADSDEDEIYPPDRELLMAMNNLRSPALYEKCRKTMIVPPNNRTLADQLLSLAKESGIDIVVDPRARREEEPSGERPLLDVIMDLCDNDNTLPVFEENRIVILRSESEEGGDESDLVKSWKEWLKRQE